MSFKYTKENLTDAVLNSTSYSGVLRFLGLRQAGGTQSHLKRRIIDFGIDTSHFTGQSWLKGSVSKNRKSSDEILVLRECGNRQKASKLRRALIEKGVDYCCSKCGQKPEWLGNPLTLDVDHINEDWLDDRIENLRFLCPNCHSQFSRSLLGS